MPRHWEDVSIHGGRTIEVPTRGAAITSKDFRGFHAHWSARRLVDRTARDEFDDDPISKGPNLLVNISEY